MFSKPVVPSGRAAYRASGRARWLLFVLLGVCTLFTAAVMGIALAVAYWQGFYWIGVAPMVAALPVAGMMYVTVAASHCRNRVAVVLLGLLAAAVCYLGYFQVTLLEHIGVQNAHRVDWLPQYIVWRMNNDIIEDVGKGEQDFRPQGPDRIKVAFNWLFFAMDAAIIAGLAIAPAMTQCVKPYSEARRGWMKSLALAIPSGSAAAAVEALQARHLPAWEPLLVDPTSLQPGYCELLVFYPPGAGSDEASDRALLTIAELGVADKQTGNRPRIERAKQWELFDDELATLAARYSALATALGTLPGEPIATAAQPRLAAEDVFIDALPEQQRGKVLSPANLTVGTVLSLGPLLGIAGTGLGLLLWLGFGAGDLPTAIGIVLLLVALGLLVAAALWGVWFADLLPSRWLYSALLRQIQMRPDAIVRPDQPEAEFIQVIPRENWGKVMVENASDVGLLVADRQRQMLLFEGDRERWAIPAGSIVSCGIEQFVVGAGEGATKFFLLVIRAQNGDSLWEGSFNRRHIQFKRRGATQVAQDAEDLRQLVLGMSLQ